MRIIMMGTGPFAVPTFRLLYDSRHSILALFTRPARELHGKSQAEANPMRGLAVVGAPLVLAAIDELEAGTTHPIEQDPAQATRAPRLKKELGQVDWSREAEAIRNQVRALKPWPKTYTFWHRSSVEPLRLILD